MSCSKESVVEFLKGKGYDADIVDGTVHVTVENPPTKKERDHLEKLIQKTGYNSSWGWGVPRKKKD